MKLFFGMPVVVVGVVVKLLFGMPVVVVVGVVGVGGSSGVLVLNMFLSAVPTLASGFVAVRLLLLAILDSYKSSLDKYVQRLDLRKNYTDVVRNYSRLL